MKQQIELHSLEDTEQLARELANKIRGGQILALSGPVGAGKTTFTKAFAAALGIEETLVSPTYTLMQLYHLPHAVNEITQLVHIDAYRLENENELRAIGFEDFTHDSQTIILIEWAENVQKLLADHPCIWMTFEIADNKRICSIT